jgi:hypothetical protein
MSLSTIEPSASGAGQNFGNRGIRWLGLLAALMPMVCGPQGGGE